ncbi:hypothetical protein GGI1_24701, partial [Acidithiobacillus sp. GGI-221]
MGKHDLADTRHRQGIDQTGHYGQNQEQQQRGFDVFDHGVILLQYNQQHVDQ